MNKYVDERKESANFVNITELLSGVERKQWAGMMILVLTASICVGGEVVRWAPWCECKGRIYLDESLGGLSSLSSGNLNVF